MFSSRKIFLWIVLLLTICFSVYILAIVIPKKFAEQSYQGAKRIGQELGQIFGTTPEVRVNNTIVLGEEKEILELATLSQQFQHQYTWENKWLNSTKKIFITGQFKAKAGFNIDQNFRVSISNQHAIVMLPPPILLSLEPLGDYTFRDEHGVWNWVDNNDRAQALNSYTADAKRYAERASFVDGAKKNIEEKMMEVFSSHHMTVSFEYTNIPIEGKER
jgi:hypothetical protein